MKPKLKLSQSAIEKKIEAIIAKVRPYIQMHNGDVTFVGFKDGVVTLEISGACTHCHMADVTYNNLIGGLIMEDIPQVKKIVLEK